ncbi:PAS domain-containing sensor histidine kinase [Natronincola ferrireducens]|uniref:histidine kinase n=1 Tax=Natronincola ferrireducens TaxID=393762 RepID=A0A1G8ZET7_9FIRM|nr:ATP-binding protein [Natronincola ferrireducens]SDK12915.1 PAS domain S-box-containing protein [Natronincola ferrireducens]
MNRAYLVLYPLTVIVNLLPFIPMSMKGILGIIFIIITSMKVNYKNGLIIATLWIVFGFINYTLDINVDYRIPKATMILGSGLYYFIAYYLGKSTESLRRKNKQLKGEIQKRENIENELKKKLTMIQSLMNTIPSPIFFKNLDYRYMGCNPAFEKALGVKEGDLIGKTSYDINDRKSADLLYSMDIQLLESGGEQVYETTIKFADGSLRNIIFNKGIFADEKGNPLGIVGVMTDITDKKQREVLRQKVVEKKREIDEILEHDKMKTEFFSNISHELRTPLNVILGSIQLIDQYITDEAYDKSQDKVKKGTVIMRQNCYRLLRLVNNLIDVSKIDASAFEINLRNCNIVTIVEEITLSVSSYIENRGISLVFDTDIEEKVIPCDDEKIERIMLNLLSNAVKFTPTGGSIFVSIHDRGNSLCINVRDTGIGIPLEKQGEIFERFCQVTDLFSRQHEGSGIGLNLVKNLVEMHGGTITVTSKLGKGTTFTISLPTTTLVEEAMEHKSFEEQHCIERISIEFSDIYSPRQIIS